MAQEDIVLFYWYLSLSLSRSLGVFAHTHLLLLLFFFILYLQNEICMKIERMSAFKLVNDDDE